MVLLALASVVSNVFGSVAGLGGVVVAIRSSDSAIRRLSVSQRFGDSC
jgi:hypothetical protein